MADKTFDWLMVLAIVLLTVLGQIRLKWQVDRAAHLFDLSTSRIHERLYAFGRLLVPYRPRHQGPVAISQG